MKSLLRGLAAVALLAAVGAASASAQDYSKTPTYGAIQLNTGFTPDPVQVNLQSGGTINAAQSIPGGTCTGYIASAPDYRVTYNAGTTFPLIISVASAADTTLVVNGPDSRWYCDDDGGVNGMNPSVRFNSPASGQYDIWVGTYGSGTLQSSTLNISEVTSQ